MAYPSGPVFSRRRAGRRGVAPAVPDRPVEHDFAVVPQAELDRRVHSRLIPVPGGLPDPFDGRGVDAGVVFVADRGDGLKICRDADRALQVILAGHASEGTWRSYAQSPR